MSLLQRKKCLFVVNIYHVVPRKIFCASQRRCHVATLCDSLDHRRQTCPGETSMESWGHTEQQQEAIQLGERLGESWEVRRGPERSGEVWWREEDVMQQWWWFEPRATLTWRSRGRRWGGDRGPQAGTSYQAHPHKLFKPSFFKRRWFGIPIKCFPVLPFSHWLVSNWPKQEDESDTGAVVALVHSRTN